MRRKLEEIIEEINNIELEKIIENMPYFYDKWKNGTLDKEEKEEMEELADDSRKSAINFITYKYEQLDKNSDATNRDYEIADFKTFERNLGIIKDQQEKERIDKELRDKVRKFGAKLYYVNNPIEEETIRAANIMFNKNGNGSLTTRIALPVPFVRALRVSKESPSVTIELNNDKIIIKKAPSSMEKYLGIYDNNSECYVDTYDLDSDIDNEELYTLEYKFSNNIEDLEKEFTISEYLHIYELNINGKYNCKYKHIETKEMKQ